jgi:SAM-dependent methyltransferase
MAVWYEHDRFWETMPMFSQEIWEAAPEEVDFFIRLLGIGCGASILDLCCGVGRHSLELARRGFQVTGVDRTGAYLETAGRKAAAEGLELELIQCDMRSFVQPESYDAAINLYTSFGYFEDIADDRRVAGNLFNSLRPGGGLVMEMMGKEVLARIYQRRDWQELPDGALFLQDRQVTEDWTWMQSRYILIRDGESSEYAVSHRIYDGAGLRELLLNAGFETVSLFGSLDGRPYDTDAPRLVAVARKAL